MLTDEKRDHLRQPLLWYGLPHGFQQLNLAPSSEQTEEISRELASLDEESGERAGQVLRFYLGVMELMRRAGVISSAIGIHPDETGGLALSVLAVSSTPVSGVNPKAVLARMLESSRGSSVELGVTPLDLPCGPAFFMETTERRRAPGQSEEEGGTEPVGRVWEGTVVVPNMKSSSMVTLQLSSAATSASGDYRQILIAVAHTLTFSNPSPDEGSHATSPGANDSAIVQEMRDTFG